MMRGKTLVTAPDLVAPNHLENKWLLALESMALVELAATT
jgi:hypothetical protein